MMPNNALERSVKRCGSPAPRAGGPTGRGGGGGRGGEFAGGALFKKKKKKKKDSDVLRIY